MRSELAALFWLQWRLTRAMFRVSRASVRLRAVMLLLRILTFVFTLPFFVLVGGGLALTLILLSPRAAYEVALLTNVFLFFIWLFLPASYNSQLAERFEMSRLFQHPISFRGVVVGSTLMSLLSMTGLWTLPILLGEIVGLAWHRPLALPLIVLGALPTFALLALTGRIMDDLFDLVAGDRRLRALVLALLILPFMLCGPGQFLIQGATANYTRVPEFAENWFDEALGTEFEKLEQVGSFDEVLQVFSRIIELVAPSRLLTWLPPGWTTAGMGLPATGEWGRGLLFLALSVAFVGLLLRVHAGVTWRLMHGAAVSIGTERVRSRRRFLHLPGPPALWALFRKDWIYLWRNPLTRPLIFAALLMTPGMALIVHRIAESNVSSLVQELAPLAVAVLNIILVGLTVNLALSANYFGAIDREGFATLAATPQDRRYVILSANLAILIYVGLQVLVVSLALALATGFWPVLPLGLYLGLCLQVGGAPAYNLAAIIGPYRARLSLSSGRQGGNLWGMLAWFVSAPPVLALTVLPYVLWKPGLVLTLPLAAVYSVGLYALTLKPLARLLQRREHAILDAVVVEE